MINQKVALKVCYILSAVAYLVAVRYTLPIEFFGIEIPDVDFLPKPYASHEKLVFYVALILVAAFLLMRNKFLADIKNSKTG